MRLEVAILVVGMLVSGTSNSVLNKLQDNQCVGNCDGPVKDQVHFEQPVFQTLQMFLPEMGCWLIWWLTRNLTRSGYQSVPSSSSAAAASHSVDNTSAPRPPPELKGKKVWLLATPAICDICGTTLMNIGLLYVPVSIYQMIRGSLVLFVGFFSVMFLKRQVSAIQWWGLSAVTFGVFLVGLSARFTAGHKSSVVAEGLERSPFEVTLGICLVLLAQLFTATQFTVEEHVLEKFSLEPLKVVAWEGSFGSAITAVGSHLIFQVLTRASSPAAAMFDLGKATQQIFSSATLLWASAAIMASIACFNFCGVSLTRSLSATSRSTVDTCRTIGVWFVSFILGWESFQFLQLVGFALLVYGTMVYNGVVHPEVQPTKITAEGEEEGL